MSVRPPPPDSEGYTQDLPAGLKIDLAYWDDLHNHWVFTDLTDRIAQAMLQKLNLNDPGWNAFTSEMKFVLQRLLETNYKAQVTGTNYDTIYWKVRAQIYKALADNLSGIADVSGVWDYSLNLADSGDYFAQLARKAPGSTLGAMSFIPDPGDGDILRLKYVTHGNYVKFTVRMNLLGEILNPLSVFSGGPSFTVTFDTVTTVDIQLPHHHSQGIPLLAASVKNTGADIHAENADGWMVKAVNSMIRAVGGTGFFTPVQRAMDDSQTNIMGAIQGAMRDLNELITKAAFDKAKYHVDWGEDPDQGYVVMDFTVDPWRQFNVSINRIQENFQGIPNSGTVKTWAKIGFEAASTSQVPGGAEELQDCFDGDPSVFRYYNYGLRYETIHVVIHREVTLQPIRGKLERGSDGSYYVHWDDGEIDNLGPDFDINQVPPGGLVKFILPPVQGGTARQFDLLVDYATGAVTARIDQTQISGTVGQQIHIPGDTSKPTIWPDVWLTIEVEGTRTPTL
jgi:hypothetical protein